MSCWQLRVVSYGRRRTKSSPVAYTFDRDCAAGGVSNQTNATSWTTHTTCTPFNRRRCCEAGRVPFNASSGSLRTDTRDNGGSASVNQASDDPVDATAVAPFAAEEQLAGSLSWHQPRRCRGAHRALGPNKLEGVATVRVVDAAHATPRAAKKNVGRRRRCSRISTGILRPFSALEATRHRFVGGEQGYAAEESCEALGLPGSHVVMEEQTEAVGNRRRWPGKHTRRRGVAGDLHHEVDELRGCRQSLSRGSPALMLASTVLLRKLRQDIGSQAACRCS